MAIKLEDAKTQMSSLNSESLILKKLNNVYASPDDNGYRFYPTYFEHGLSPKSPNEKEYYFLIMEYLEFGLQEYLALP